MPHGHCYYWTPEVLWLSVLSDSTIAIAYYSIPVALVYFVRKRSDLAFSWMFVLFGIFIFLCGTTHIMEIWTVWNGTYRLSGVVKLLTALASIATAIVLLKILPQLLALPSPALLAEKNVALEKEMKERAHAEELLRNRSAELEHMNKFMVGRELKMAELKQEIEELKKKLTGQ